MKSSHKTENACKSLNQEIMCRNFNLVCLVISEHLDLLGEKNGFLCISAYFRVFCNNYVQFSKVFIKKTNLKKYFAKIKEFKGIFRD